MSQSIPEVSQITFNEFHNEVVPAGQPLVIRGLVDHWPLVKAGQAGAVEFCDYVRQFDSGKDVSTVSGPASIKGRIFYNTDLSGINCRMSFNKLAGSLDYLLAHMNDETPPTLALQSVVVNSYLSGMEIKNINPLLDTKIQPRIWLGTRTTVAAHYDPSENIACCLVGRRKFTLLPLEQVKNLYIGPLENTPAGAAISMVDFDNPDYQKFPRFAEAEKAFMTTTLEPGDAIYIPYLWWHQVKSLENINGLMNYWWSDIPSVMGDPKDVLLHAMLAVKYLPKQKRDQWKALFDHYVFEENGSLTNHLPEGSHGILNNPSERHVQELRGLLIKSLSRLS